MYTLTIKSGDKVATTIYNSYTEAVQEFKKHSKGMTEKNILKNGEWIGTICEKNNFYIYIEQHFLTI